MEITNYKNMIPQIAFILMFIIALLYSAFQHGKPKEEKYNFWMNLEGAAIEFVILYLGGFFDCFFK